MTYPQQFGLPQILLAILTACALLILLSSVLTLRRVKRSDNYGGTRQRRLRLRPIRAISGLTLLGVAILIFWFVSVVQTYLGLTGEVKAAHVVATSINDAQHSLHVDLTLYGDKGKPKPRAIRSKATCGCCKPTSWSLNTG